MAASAGRQISLNWGNTSPATEIGGLREKGVELNGEPIDITSDDDNGWRTLLTVPAQNEINISLSGVSKDDTLKTAWFAGTRTEECVITFADGGELQGTFYLATFTETGTYNEATVFEAELQSSGVVTYTPGSP
jgi:predicted secreted protein